MKILLIGTDGKLSGASLSMVTVANEARKKGMEMCIIIPSHGPLEKVLNDNNLKYHVIKSHNWIWPYKNTFSIKNNLKKNIKKLINICAEYRIEQIMKSFQPDIIHINTICSGMGAYSAYKLKKPVVWHIREFVEEDHGYYFWNKKKSYNLISKASSLIAISNSVYHKFSVEFGRNDIATIYNGVDLKKYYDNSEHCFENEVISIYMGGSIAESKGQSLLIDALKIVKEKTSQNFEVHMLGAGNKKYIESLKEKTNRYNLETTVFFDGLKEDMPNEWKKADIAITASRAEAFGRVTVEAMLAGALAIGANSAGTSEIIENKKTGLLFENNNAFDLAAQILWAFEHKNEAKQIALNGKKDVYVKFSSERNANEIIDIYKKTL